MLNLLQLDVIQNAINNTNKSSFKKLNSIQLPGPTGESNVLSFFSRGLILCLGPTLEMALLQSKTVKENGCIPLIITPNATGSSALSGSLNRADLTKLNGFKAVVCWSDESDQRNIRIALAEKPGPIIPLINHLKFSQSCIVERHLCIDTTAAGGNAALLASSS
jgi:RHH-type proline utilization regulon transcriptional repressor/proline dehydrogenase/delta 1-pyrroline-5-carboxylate dehydrogenase